MTRIPDVGPSREMSAMIRALDRIEAAVRILYPDDMTPNAKRVIESIIEDERCRLEVEEAQVDSRPRT